MIKKKAMDSPFWSVAAPQSDITLFLSTHTNNTS